MKDYPYRVDVDARLRNYTYKAYLTATGKVAQLRAGCRVWPSFDDARNHYCGQGPYNATKWSDETFTAIYRQQGFWPAAKQYAQRADARKTLDLLEDKVTRLQERIARKRKKARKAKKRSLPVGLRPPHGVDRFGKRVKPAVRRRKARR